MLLALLTAMVVAAAAAFAIVTGTTVATFAARTTGTTIATFVTRTTRTGSLLYITLGFRKHSATAQLELAALLVDSDDLNLDHIANVNLTFKGLGTSPVVFADVHEAFFAREELEEGAELNDAYHFSVINLADLRNGSDVFDPLDSSIDALLVGRSDIDTSEIAILFDSDSGTGLALDFLNNFATLADNSADELFGDGELNDAGNERLVILARSGNNLFVFAKDVETTLTSLFKSLSEDVVA